MDLSYLELLGFLERSFLMRDVTDTGLRLSSIIHAKTHRRFQVFLLWCGEKWPLMFSLSTKLDTNASRSLATKTIYKHCLSQIRHNGPHGEETPLFH